MHVLCNAEDRVSLYVVNRVLYYFFFFSSRRRHTRSLCDWSSDVCSSDLFYRYPCSCASAATESKTARIAWIVPFGPMRRADDSAASSAIGEHCWCSSRRDRKSVV